MSPRPITELLKERVEPKVLLAGIATEASSGPELASRLLREAQSFGLGLRDYLTLKVDPRVAAEAADRQRFDGLNGYEASLAFLNLPIKNEFAAGATLQAAADTFQTFPGTRALFPQVIDDMIHWSYRQDEIEQIAPILANTRTVNGAEILTTVIDDEEDDYQAWAEIAEGSRIPIKSIRATEHAVKFFKHGMAYRTTYEFNRRVSLDILTPYANRAARELNRSKLKRATALLISGDSVYSAAPTVNQSSYNAAVGTNSTNGKLSFLHVLRWLVARAQAGTPVDTVVGDWDAWFQWTMMLATPGAAQGPTAQDMADKAGFSLQANRLVSGKITFALSSSAASKTLIGLSKGDTLEELVEAGSQISESEQAMSNQTITYYKTENSGFRLVFGDTRSIFNYNA